MPDALEMLIADHRKVERLYADFESSPSTKLVQQICNELTVHAAIEEEVIYPLLDQLPDGSSMREEAEEEHQEAKDTIAEIEAAGCDPEQTRSMVDTLMESVNHHVEEEENEVFPKMRDALGGERLDSAGQELAVAKLQHLRSVVDLEELSKDELYELAQSAGVDGRSDMAKDDLVKALQRA
ncbi:MAG TPA: Rho termination factor N-terminal domain-containing protein [Acidimicrobiales bacterium]|nr:Rho termination factor N-terminal domain-containing protein [Acidimicrobiales bacterium]